MAEKLERMKTVEHVMAKINEAFQQYQDGLIYDGEFARIADHALHTFVDNRLKKAKRDVEDAMQLCELFGVDLLKEIKNK